MNSRAVVLDFTGVSNKVLSWVYNANNTNSSVEKTREVFKLQLTGDLQPSFKCRCYGYWLLVREEG